MPLRILLNYRRGDTAGNAGRLYETLGKRFGEENVFMDIDKIEPGLNFVDVIKRWVDSCDVFLALIGQQWLNVTDASGRRRLDDPGDFVRLEIEAALARDIRLIPVLVQDVDMPTTEQLPPSLHELALRNGLEIRDVSWQYDVSRLIEALEKIEGPQPAEPDDPGQRRTADRDRGGRRGGLGRTRVAIAAGAALVVLALIAGVLLLRDGDDPTPPADGAPIATSSELLAFAENGRLYTIAGDGSDEVDLTRARGRDHQPDWSPDGKQLAVARGGDIIVLDSNGENPRPLTDGPEVDNAPSWSPDGTRIAFDRAERGSSGADVWIVNANRTQTNLTDGPDESGGAPDWSGDGSRIVYQRKGALWTMGADGSDQRKVELGLRGSVHEPSWSPRSDEILFALFTATHTSDIYVYTLDELSRPPRNLTNGGVPEPTFPAWSSDGRRIVFAAADGIWTMGGDGANPTRLTQGSKLETPSWHPTRG